MHFEGKGVISLGKEKNCHAREQAQYYLQRVNYYKHYDGKEGRRYRRDDLWEFLLDWHLRFPQVVRSQKSTLTETVVAAGAGAGDIVAFPACW